MVIRNFPVCNMFYGSPSWCAHTLVFHKILIRQTVSGLNWGQAETGSVAHQLSPCSVTGAGWRTSGSEHTGCWLKMCFISPLLVFPSNARWGIQPQFSAAVIIGVVLSSWCLRSDLQRYRALWKMSWIRQRCTRRTKGNSVVDFSRAEFRSTLAFPSRSAFEQGEQRKKGTKRRWTFKNTVCAICCLHVESLYLAGRRSHLRVLQYTALSKKSG